jgi:transposase InsO family protein
MGQMLHGSAATTHAVRAAIQRSQASTAELSRTDLEIEHRLTKPNHPWTNGPGRTDEPHPQGGDGAPLPLRDA